MPIQSFWLEPVADWCSDCFSEGELLLRGTDVLDSPVLSDPASVLCVWDFDGELTGEGGGTSSYWLRRLRNMLFSETSRKICALSSSSVEFWLGLFSIRWVRTYLNNSQGPMHKTMVYETHWYFIITATYQSHKKKCQVDEDSIAEIWNGTPLFNIHEHTTKVAHILKEII